MTMEKLQDVMLSGLMMVALFLAAAPAQADTQYIRKDGNLTVQYGNQCSTTKPTGSYRDRNGATGNLIDNGRPRRSGE